MAPRQVAKKPCCYRMDGASRLRENYVGTRELRGSTRVTQQQNTPAGCSKRLSNKAAGESKPEEVPTALRGAVRPFNGSWRTEKPLQYFRSPRISIGTLRI